MNNTIDEIYKQSQANSDKYFRDTIYPQAFDKCSEVADEIKKKLDEGTLHLHNYSHSAHFRGPQIDHNNCGQIADVFSQAFPHFGVEMKYDRYWNDTQECTIRVHHKTTEPSDDSIDRACKGSTDLVFFPRDQGHCDEIKDLFNYFPTRSTMFRQTKFEFTQNRNMLYVSSKVTEKKPFSLGFLFQWI